MTIVVREDNRRVQEEKTRLQNEREQIQRLKRQLNETERNIRNLSGKGQGGEALQQALANLRRVQATQDKLFEQRRRDLDERERRLATAAKPAAAGGEGSRARLDALRQGQGQLRQEIGALKSSMQDIAQQLRLLLARIDKIPSAVPVVPIARSPSGKVVSRRVIDRLYKKAQKKQRARGLKVHDLQGYEKYPAQIRTALKAGDNALAYDLVKQYQQAVDTTPINAAFVQRKMGWVNQLLTDVKLDPAKRKQKDQLLQKATQRFTDGKFAAANQQLNRIVDLIE